MHTYTYHRRVRYRECDPMGIVYHTHFLDYFEEARTEALRALGVTYRELEAGGVMMPVVDVQVQYHRPARYDDRLAIETRFTKMPTARVAIEYTVRRDGEDELLVEGSTTLCFVDAERRRPMAAPEAVREAFERILANGQ